MQDSETELDKIFLSYNKILKRLNNQGYKTKSGKEIKHKDLCYAIDFMIKKHPYCRWRSEKINSKRYYILIEGYYWLIKVFFQNEKKLIDADINFFEMRIKLYEDLLKIKPKILFDNDIIYSDLEKYFERKIDTIRKALEKIEKENKISYRYKKDNRLLVSKKGIELLCKKYFKHKYLKLLEEYKMELTEKYIKAGYIYDNFFNLN